MSKIKETSTHFSNKKSLAEECIEIYAANLIGGQWTLVICCHLLHGSQRFGELKKSMPGITERMLTLNLRKMEKNHLIKRTVYAEVPPRVEYELTPIGLQLEPVLHHLIQWGEKHREYIRQDTGHKILL